MDQVEHKQTVAKLVDDLFALSMLLDMVRSGSASADLIDRGAGIVERCQRHAKSLQDQTHELPGADNGRDPLPPLRWS